MVTRSTDRQRQGTDSADDGPPVHGVPGTFGSIDIYLFDQILRGRFQGRTRILDAGCGTGRNLVWFLRSGHTVFAADRDPRAVDQVRALAAQLAPGLRTDHIRVAEIDSLPWSDAGMDAVICSAVLHFARDPDHFGRMLEELWRVLQPGGLLFTRLASTIGLEVPLELDPNRRARLPDGSDRFLVDQPFLEGWERRLGARRLDPLKTTNVENLRCMTTWVLGKPA